MNRRDFLASGALVVGFTLLPWRLLAQAPQESGESDPALPKDLGANPMLESWIRIDADGAVTVFTGKAELGQGIRTALIQVAAEELSVAPDTIKL